MYLNVIEVEIKNKKAVRTNDTAYVCDNSDFTVVFSFDEEWDEFDVKTARFAYDGKHQDVVFTGTECEMPIISNTKLISVGVFSGDLHTTTPAQIVANKSILGVSGTPEPPSEDVYSQIIELINNGIGGGGSVVVDDVLDIESKNPISNSAVAYEIDNIHGFQGDFSGRVEVLESDLYGLYTTVNQHAHFKGYFATNAKIQSTDATPNDFAYSAESGTKWVYEENEYGEGVWVDTKTPVPDQMTPASDTTPLVNGTASVGQENAYARGDHRHPTDTTRASVAELNALKADIAEGLDRIISIQETLIGGGSV